MSLIKMKNDVASVLEVLKDHQGDNELREKMKSPKQPNPLNEVVAEEPRNLMSQEGWALQRHKETLRNNKDFVEVRCGSVRSDLHKYRPVIWSPDGTAEGCLRLQMNCPEGRLRHCPVLYIDYSRLSYIQRLTLKKGPISCEFFKYSDGSLATRTDCFGLKKEQWTESYDELPNCNCSYAYLHWDVSEKKKGYKCAEHDFLSGKFWCYVSEDCPRGEVSGHYVKSFTIRNATKVPDKVKWRYCDPLQFHELKES